MANPHFVRNIEKRYYVRLRGGGLAEKLLPCVGAFETSWRQSHNPQEITGLLQKLRNQFELRDYGYLQ